ncbi:MAG: peptide deformylase [Chthoniobacterales bacterium]|nr:peptide deformylase [Chthoniobacterales bacterium]
MLAITKLGHPVLRAKAEPVAQVDDALRRLAADMLEAMYSHDGCGLAANQVGVARRIIVIDTREAKKRPSVLRIGGKSRPVHKHMPMVLVNPEIELCAEREIGSEACLSIPGVHGDVERSAMVRVRGTDLDGAPVEFEAEGLLSRALQHEVDHLDGILFIDRLTPADRKRVADELHQLAGGMVG